MHVPISCQFRDRKVLLVMSLTQARSAVPSIELYLYRIMYKTQDIFRLAQQAAE